MTTGWMTAGAAVAWIAQRDEGYSREHAAATLGAMQEGLAFDAVFGEELRDPIAGLPVTADRAFALVDDAARLLRDGCAKSWIIARGRPDDGEAIEISDLDWSYLELADEDDEIVARDIRQPSALGAAMHVFTEEEAETGVEEPSAASPDRPDSRPIRRNQTGLGLTWRALRFEAAATVGRFPGAEVDAPPPARPAGGLPDFDRAIDALVPRLLKLGDDLDRDKEGFPHVLASGVEMTLSQFRSYVWAQARAKAGLAERSRSGPKRKRPTVRVLGPRKALPAIGALRGPSS